MKQQLSHAVVFFIFFIFFITLYHNKALIYGDFGSTFSFNNLLYIPNYLSTWLNNSFLGYEVTLYVLTRLPFYLMNDIISFISQGNWFWLAFVLIYFFRYYFFYKLLRYYKVNHSIALLVSFIYSINFYYIDRLGHTLISFASISIPLFIIAYNNLIEKITWKYLGIFLFSVWIILSSMHVTLMTMYFSIIYSTYFLINAFKNKNIISFIRTHIIVGFFIGLIFSYIWSPVIYSKLIVKNTNIIDQVITGAQDWIYNLGSSTTLIHVFTGTGYFFSAIYNNTTLVVLGLFLFLLYILPIIYSLKYKKDVHFNIFLITYLFFTGLSSLEIIKNYIPYLKQYLLGFGAIKDSAYFILYSQFSLFILLGISLQMIAVNKPASIGWIKRYLFFTAIILGGINIFCFNQFQYLKPINIPESYFSLKNYISLEGRVLVVPSGWVTKFDWSGGITSGFFNVFLGDKEVVGQNILEGPSFTTQKKIESFNKCLVDNCESIKKYIGELTISTIVDFKNAHDISQDIESSKTLDSLKGIKFLIEKNIIYLAFENEDYRIYSVSDEYLMKKISINEGDVMPINETQYNLTLKNVAGKQDIIFRESYNKEWGLYISKINTKSNISKIFQQPLFEDSHKLVYDYANQWTIDPEYIKANFDESMYKENSDGSIDVELTLYFKPQSYFYLGIIISGTTLILCLGYLGFYWFRRRRSKSTSSSVTVGATSPNLSPVGREGNKGQKKKHSKSKGHNTVKIKK